MISVGQKEVKPHPQPHPQPQAAQGGDDEFELSEEDLAAWAGSLVDDRQKKQGVCVWGGEGRGYVCCVCLHVWEEVVGVYEVEYTNLFVLFPQNQAHQRPNLVQNQSNR